jgi:hypothetical protein
MEEVCLGKAKDVIHIGPVWEYNWDHGVKAGDSQFKDAPKIVVPNSYWTKASAALI